MAYTYSKIASVTVGSGGSPTVNFIAIPQNYTDLLIFMSVRGTSNFASAGNVSYIKPNGSNVGLSRRIIYGTGTASGSDPGSDWAAYITPSDYTANTFSNSSVYIPNYAGSANKSVSIDSVNENNATAAQMLLGAGLWSNTSFITSLEFSLAAGSFAQYSTFTLYGIKAEV